MEPTPSEDGLGFADLDLRPELLTEVASLGYEEPTPIQREAIPLLRAGRDLLGQAATGTGKTAAFALPILHRLAEAGPQDAPRALVLVPTRELAMQVAEAFHRYGRALELRVLPIYGGQPIGRQLKRLRRGVDIVVATPGRALDHLGRGTLSLDAVEVLVLDEADEMLDMGFAEDLDAILAEVPEARQTLLFSATLPRRVHSMAKRHLRDPETIALGRAKVDEGGAPLVRQTVYVVARPHKLAALGRILDLEAPTAALVFCRTRLDVDQLTEALNGRGYRAEALHGGLSQEARDRVMRRLRSGVAELLVATDVAARGLDVDVLTHVINHDVPSSPEVYVHRIGRVGRAGREGVAITLAQPREHRQVKNIERLLKKRLPVEKLPTIADLKARRLDLTRASLREVLLEDDLDRFRVVVDALTDEFDVIDVAVAAVKLAHEASRTDLEEEDIPDPRERRERPEKKGRARPGTPAEGMVRIYVSLGRRAGIRPGDLVGAIANETDLPGRAIGFIEIADGFSLVEVPDEAAKDVIAALRATTIKGLKAKVRRDRYAGR